MNRVLSPIELRWHLLVPTTGLEPAYNILEGWCLSIRLRGHKFTVEVCTPHLGTASKAGPCRLTPSVRFGYYTGAFTKTPPADTPQSEREVSHLVNSQSSPYFIAIESGKFIHDTCKRMVLTSGLEPPTSTMPNQCYYKVFITSCNS